MWSEVVFTGSLLRALFLRALFLLLGNLRTCLASFAESYRYSLLATFDFLAAAGLKRAFFMLLHDFLDFASSLRSG